MRFDRIGDYFSKMCIVLSRKEGLKIYHEMTTATVAMMQSGRLVKFHFTNKTQKKVAK